MNRFFENMKAEFLLSLAVLLLILVSFGSCRTDKDMQIMPVVKEPITVQEAKGWYNTLSDKSARPSGSIFHNRLIYWDGAQSTYLPNGTPIISIPLFYNYRKPVIIAQEASFIKSEGHLPVLVQSIEELQISKKLIIGKDGKGGYRSCVMVTIPTDDYRKAATKITTATFMGSQLYYNENEIDFMLGMQYNKGHLMNVIRANSKKDIRSACYKAIYHSTPPNQIDGLRKYLAAKAKQLNMPVIFQDKAGIIYSLFDIVHTDCDTGAIGSPLVAPIPTN